MAKTALVQSRLEPRRKEKVGEILKRLGMTHSEAIGIFYSLVEEYNGLPFPVRIPNKESRKALANVKAGNVTEYQTLEEMIEDAESW